MMIDNSTLYCLSCTFKNNTAIQGGGLYIASNSTQILIAQLTNSIFRSNNAWSYGGGILVKTFEIKPFNCTNIKSPCARVVLFEARFKDNEAPFASNIMATTPENILVTCRRDYAIAYILIGEEKIEEAFKNKTLIQLHPEWACASKDNRRLFSNANGVAIGTFGHKLDLSANNEDGSQIVGNASSGFVFKNAKSGIPLSTIRVTSIDALGNANAPLFYEKNTLIINSTSMFLQQQLILSFTNDTCNISGLVGYVDPGNYMIQLYPRVDDLLQATNLTIVVRDCTINEEPKSEGKLCIMCGEASYNFNKYHANGCTPCPKNANCITRYIVPNEGYWHKSPCHDQVKKCIAEKACKKHNRSVVLEQFTKNETKCTMNETMLNATKDIKGHCVGAACANAIIVILTFLGATAYLLIGAIISIKGVLPSPSNQLNEQDSESLLLELSSSALLKDGIKNQGLEEIKYENANVISQQPACEESVERSNPSAQLNVEIKEKKQKLVECWKICLNFFQVTSMAASMDVKWTKKILVMLKGLNVLGAAIIGSVTFSIDCLISSSSNATKAIWRLLFSLFVPNIVILLLALHWGYRCFTKHGRNHLYFSKRLLLTVVTVTYITYFDLTQVAIRVFSCVGVHVNMNPFSNAITRYWIGDTSIKCYENTHIILMGIALVILVLVSICFPILCSITLSQKKDEVRDTTSWTYETLGFLGGLFKKNFIYWECITMIKKALLSIIIVFSYSLGNQIQGLLILLVLVLFLYFHFLCYPYAKEYHTLNYYESGSLLVSCVTYTLVQFFNVERCSEVTRSIVSLVLIAINGGFICIMAFKIIREATNLVRAFLNSKNIRIPEKANIVTLLKVYFTIKRSRISSP
eukprot:g3824.t1